jgi:iron complex outermembrane receptor protein
MNAPDRPAGSRRRAGILAGLAIALSSCRPLLCTALLAAASIPLAAQEAGTGVITGRVLHAVTGDALNNAQVSLKGTNRRTATDSGGFYQLTGVPAGTATIEVSFAGLDTQAATVTVTSGLGAQQDFSLTSASRYGDRVQLDPYTVNATRTTDASAIAVNEQRNARNITSVVSADEFGTIVNTNPGELLKWLPGVDVETFANNIVGVSVRGLGAVNTELSFDGMPVASMNAEAVGRNFDVQYSSAADIARVEIRKLPLPQDSSNALGGAINLIRRSAFEYSRRQISYKAVLVSDGEEFTTEDIDGPKDVLRNRWRPNWEVKWTEPLSRTLGFAVTLGSNNTITNTHWSLPGWDLATNTTNAANNTFAAAEIAAGRPAPTDRPSIYNPAMRNPLNHNAPLLQGQTYASARADWRPRPELTLSSSVAYTRGYKQVADDIRYRWDTGASSNTVSSARFTDATSTLGRVGGGAIFHDNPLWRDIDAPTLSYVLDAKWKKGAWEAGATGTWSESKYTYRDTENGFFNSTSVGDVTGITNIGHTGVGAGTANPISMIVNFHDHDYWAPGRIEAFTTATGAASTNAADYTVPVEWWKNSLVRIGGARSRPGTSKEIITAAKLFAKYQFNTANPLNLRLGLDYTDRFRNRKYDYLAWRFVGADGVANSADDSASLMAADNIKSRPDAYYGYPGAERISMSKLYDLYVAHPNWFQFDEHRSLRLSATNNAAYDLSESITAPYVQFDWTLFRNRLQLTGGVRYEKNEAEARGLFIDNAAAYQKYSDGTVIRSADVLGSNGLPTSRAGNPVFLPGVTANSIEQARLTLKPKGAYAETSYDNYFPSLHATFNITPEFVFQAGYAKTQAANRFDRSLIPNNDITDTVVSGSGALGTIRLRNPNLKPWMGDNLEARLSYYTKSGGLFGVGAFHKRISDYQVTLTTAPLTADELEEFGFGPQYVGYEINSMFNQGTATVKGFEVEARQSLDQWLPGWAKGFLVRGTAGFTKMSGQPAGGDFANIRDKRYTVNVGYRNRKLSVNAGYIMNGQQINNGAVTSNGRTGQQITVPQHMVDFSVEYSINKWARVFFSGNNLLDEYRARNEVYEGRPDAKSLNSSNTFGIVYSLGITGSF